MNEHVILLHGLWMRGLVMSSLARRLRDADYSVDVLDYPSVAGGPQQGAERLIAALRAAKSPRVHLVGHSLGGMVALHALQSMTDAPAGNVVCLGSPLRGSSAAQKFAHWPVGSWLLGRSSAALCQGIECWDNSRPLGVIAGSLPMGFGFVIGGLEAPHDGTVSVAETQIEGLSDHCVVAATHTGLVFSAEAAKQTVAFLSSGRFAHLP